MEYFHNTVALSSSRQPNNDNQNTPTAHLLEEQSTEFYCATPGSQKFTTFIVAIRNFMFLKIET
jgi:hypothetical protein